MASELLDIKAYQPLSWYPHMGEFDQVIWNRFIKAFPDAYNYCRYDVAVGPGPQFDPTVNHDTGGDAYRLYQRRIDVVAHKDDEVDIVEVKRRAGASAVGQLKMYRMYYMQDYPSAKTPKLVLVTDELVAGMDELCAGEGVQLVIV